MPVGVVLPAVSLEVGVLCFGVRLDHAPVAAEHVLALVDESSGGVHRRFVHDVLGHRVEGSPASVRCNHYRRGSVNADAAWYRPFEPPARLRSLVSCSWEARPGGQHRLTPDGCTDLLYVSDGTFVLCGPERRSWTFRLPAGSTAVGVRFRPGSAHAIFGLDVSTITDRRVDVAALIGQTDAAAIADAVGRAGGLEARRQRLLTEVERLIDQRADVDTDLARFADLILETLLGHPRASRTQLAAVTNVSVRELHRRSVRVFGYGTATLARLLRFQRLVALAASSDGHRPLAVLAADAGYSDHAHLVRDCRAIASMTPTEYFSVYFPTFPDLADPYKTSTPLVATLEG